MLNGQPMAVPAGNKDGVVAHHGPGLDNKIFENLVQGVAHVDVAVGVRGAVVEDPHATTRSKLPEFLIDLPLLPRAKNLRLSFREARLHGKGRLGQVEGRLVVHHASETKAPIGTDEGLVTAVTTRCHYNNFSRSLSSPRTNHLRMPCFHCQTRQ